MAKLTDKQIKELIDTIVVVIDSREKLPNHITKAFDKYNVNWEVRKLKSGDYTAYLPENKELNIERIDLTDVLAIERKMSADEISINLSTKKKRFIKEFDRSNAKILIVIENDTYSNIATHKYKSKLNPKSFLGLLHSHVDKYNTSFVFVDKHVSALYIYNIFKYRIKNILKNLK